MFMTIETFNLIDVFPVFRCVYVRKCPKPTVLATNVIANGFVCGGGW